MAGIRYRPAEMARRAGGAGPDAEGPSRRTILRGAALAALGIGMPFVRRASAAERSLKVATFGGCFERSLVHYLYPEFEAATGIKVESVSQAGGPASLIRRAAAAGAEAPPMDLCTAAQDEVRRGSAEGLWRGFDTRRIPGLRCLDPRFVHAGAGGVDAVGAMAWYQTLVVDPNSVRPMPGSWKVLWDADRRESWGLAAGGRSTLFEITASTWFGGNAILETEDGILQVMAKIEELRPNVKLWWNSEGEMQVAYENREILGGMYFHDVAGLMARDGTAIASIFPDEGGVIDFGSWCQPASSTKVEEAEAFVDFMCSPAAQATMTRRMGTAPLIDRRLTDLSDAEFRGASSDRPPIAIAVDARARLADFMNRQFIRMLVG
jgi:putative spermidine/putrescine transport system substrate-binding protein